MNNTIVIKKFLFLNLILCLISVSYSGYTQTKGIIYDPAGTGASVLDPNMDGYTSSNTSGFVTNDEIESEIAYVGMPSVGGGEPDSDLHPGPSCGFTDLVQSPETSSSYTYFDGTNLLFRFRLGTTANNSKGYSILIDTDEMFGFSGDDADPNAVPGNPGFEIEVVLLTNFGVAIYDVDGTTNGIEIGTHTVDRPYDDFAQKSVALTEECADDDYFYDFYIPISDLSSLGVTATTPLRMVGTTVISPNSALTNSLSDISGIDDQSGPSDEIFEEIIDVFPPTPPVDIPGGLPERAECPSINAPIDVGATSISGTSSEVDGATITVYRDGVSVGTTTVIGGSWTLSGLSAFVADEIFTATALVTDTVATATGTEEKSESYDSCNTTTVGASCSPVPTVSIDGGAPSTRGFCALAGSAIAGAQIRIYHNGVELTPGSGSDDYISGEVFALGDGSFRWKCNTQSNCTGGSNCGFPTSDTLEITQQEPGKCESEPFYYCPGGIVSDTPLFSPASVVETDTTISGTATAGASITIYIDDVEQASTTATGGNWSFTVASLPNGTISEGEVISVRSIESGECPAINTVTVGGISQTPVIVGDYCSSASSFSGTSSEVGGTITLYSSATSPVTTSDTVVGTAIVQTNGSWTVSGSVPANHFIAATAQNTGELVSLLSNEVQVLSPTTSTITITTTTLNEGDSSVSGTTSAPDNSTVYLYLDGFQEAGFTATVTGGMWTITGLDEASAGYNVLYAGAIVEVSVQEPGLCEGDITSQNIEVQCELPIEQAFSATSTTTVCEGETITFSIANTESLVIYELEDQGGNGLGSILGTGASVSLTSLVLTTSVTDVYLKAIKIGGTTCEVTSSVSIPVVVQSLPEVLLTTSAFTICEGDSSVDLDYTVTANGPPISYSIDFDTTAETEGFSDVTDNTSFTSPITVTVPVTASTGTYNGVFTIKNSNSIECQSVGVPFTITINTLPATSIGGTSNPTTCGGANGSITISGLEISTLYDDLAYTDDGTLVNVGSFTTDATGAYEITGLDAGSYDNIIVTLNGCDSSELGPVTLSDPGAPTIAEGTHTNPTSCSSPDGIIVITGTVSGVTYNVDYSFNGTAQPTQSIVATATGIEITGLDVGSYTNISVIDASTCKSNTIAGPIVLSNTSSPVATTNDITVCSGVTTASIILTITSGTPVNYTIDYDITAEGEGFTDVSTPTSLTGATYAIPMTVSEGTYNGVLTFIDASGCIGADPFTITIDNTDSPTVTGSLTTITTEGCDVSAAPIAVNSVADLESMGVAISDDFTTDADLDITNVDTSSGSCPITVSRVYTISDDCGNSTNVSQTITINVATFTISDADGSSTVNCIADATETFSLPTITDVCGNTLTASSAVITENPDPLSCEGTRTYTYTYTDCAGNNDTWSFVYTIDTPTFTISDADGSSTVNCIADATETFSLPTITDVCGNTLTASSAVITENPDPLNCEGTRTYTYTYTDCAGNSDTWSYVYTIDTPIFTISDADGSSTVNCIADATETFSLPTITDVCGNTLTASSAVITDTPSTLSCEGTRTYTYTYTDCAGNSDTWSFVYTIDTPTFTISDADGSSTVNCIADATETFSLPTITDVCGNTLTASSAVITENPDPLSCEGTRTYTYTYTDCAGNSDTWSYVYTIDTPTFTIGDADGSSTVNCIADAIQPTAPTVVDICGNTIIPVITENTDPACEGDKIYTYTYTDCAGNQQIYTYTYVIDYTIIPVVPVDAGSTVNSIDEAIQPIAPVVTDNCGNTVTPVITENTSPLCDGEKIYTFTYTDCGGNVSVYTYTYTIDVTSTLEIADTSVTNCSDVALNYDLTNLTTLTGATFDWVVTPNTNVSGAIDGSGTILNDAITNVSGVPQDILYTITPYNSDGCIGNTFELVVTITPEPVNSIAPSNTTCSNVSVNHDLTEDVDLLGSTFSWVATDNPNVSGETTTPSSATTIADTLINTSGAVQTVTYTITPTSSDNCTGNSYEYVVTVSPEATLVVEKIALAPTDGSYDTVGEVIQYEITVENTSDVALSNMLLTDANADSGSISPATAVSIPALGSVTYTAEHTITQTDLDAGEVINGAEINGEDPCGNVVSETSDDPSTTGSNDDTIVVLDQSPSISLLKAVTFNDENGDGFPQEGETLTYNFTVENTGNVTVTDISITDPIVTVNGGPIDLAPTESDTTTFTAIYSITQANIDSGSITNTAMATGTDPNGDSVTDDSDDPNTTDPDDATVFEFDESPELTVYKTGVFIDANGDGLAQVGETINYTFDVINTGNVTISNITISDPVVTVSGSAITLAPTENDNSTFTATYTLTQTDIDNGSVTNTATASGESPSGDTVTDDSDDPTTTDSNDPTITTLSQDPQLTLLKTSVFNDESGNGFPEVGETITYTFDVRNTGNVTITNISITDPLVTVTGGPIDLDPSETDDTTFTAIYTITLSDINAGGVTNSATVSGEDPSGDTVLDISDDPNNTDDNDANGDGNPDDDTFTTLDANPQLSIEKIGVFADENGDGITQVGETIDYTFNIINTGNVTISNITVSDALVTVSGSAISLDPTQNDDTTFTATYTITQSDIDSGSITNSATVIGEDPNSNSVTDTSDDPNNTDDIDPNGDGEPDDDTITTLPVEGTISLTKIALPATDGSYDTLGEVINYELVITNTGNVTLTNIEVTDANADIGSISPATITSLDPGATVTVNAEHTITQDDLNAGEVNNSASVTAEDPSGNIVDDVSDDPNNTTDDDPDGDNNPDDVTSTLIDQLPSMELEKVSVFNDENGDGVPQLGETLTYNFSIENTGNVTISNITISDPLVTVNGGPITLAPTEVNSTTFYANYVLTQADIDNGSVTNSATVNGESPSGGNVTDTSDDPTTATSDDPTITNLSSDPELTIAKTGVFIDTNGDGLAQVGETIQYIFDVTNTGNVTITNIMVSDPLVTVSGSAITLIPGETDSTTFTAEYILTQTDVNNGSVENQATVNGQDPSGNNVTDDSDDPTTASPDDPTITTLARDPQLSLYKIGTFNDENGDGIPQVGETISYVFDVRNTGNVTIFDVVVTDPIVTVSGSAIDLDPAEIDNTTFSAVYTILQEDIDAGNLTNTAIVNGEDIDGSIVTDVSDYSDDPDNPTNEDLNGDGDPDDPTVTTLTGNPELNLDKIGTFNDENGDGIAQVGETITYAFEVSNIGNMTITNISITDPLVTVSGGPIDLNPTEIDTNTFTATYTISQFDVDSGGVTNSATVSGQDPNGNPISDNSDDPNNSANVDDNNDGNPDDDTFTTLPSNPSMSIEKVGLFNDEDGDGLANVGETITYSFTITNTGNVTISNISITDPLVTVEGDPITLAPNESDSTTFTAEYILTQSDIDNGNVENQATVNGEDPSGNPVTDISDDPNTTDPDDATITDLPSNPSMSIEKVGMFNDEDGDGLAEVGETISYSFTITNTGNVTISNISITDPIVTVDGGPISLLPNESDDTTFTAIYILTQIDVDNGNVENQATVNGEDSSGNPVSDISDDPNTTDADDPTITSLPQSGSIDIVKEVDSDSFTNIGDILTYTITVTNTGNTTLTNVEVTDANATFTTDAIIASLAPGEIFVTTAEHEVTSDDVDAGLVENTAYVNATDANGTIVTEDSDDPNNDTNLDVDGDGDYEDATISTFEGISDLSITKEVDIIEPVVGDEVIFTITLTNEGVVSATNITVLESLPSGYEYVSHITTDGVYTEADGYWTIDLLEANDIQILEVTVRVLGDGDYENTASIDSFDGAEDMDLSNNSATATVYAECLTVFREFSPNGDDTNDYLHISCLEREEYQNNSLEIFNRWGNTVYKAKGYNNGDVRFEGISNGRATINIPKQLPVGTYFYVLDLGDGSDLRKGWLYINR